jgi:hypothetical protein
LSPRWEVHASRGERCSRRRYGTVGMIIIGSPLG